jgi:hypothetical protein
MAVGGQRHAPAALPPGMIQYPLYRRLGGPQGRSGRLRKISPPPGYFFYFKRQFISFKYIHVTRPYNQNVVQCIP